MDRVDGKQGARAAGDAEAAEVQPAPPPGRRGVRRSALADALEAEDDNRLIISGRSRDGGIII